MYLRSIKLLKFRNLSKSFNFSDKINLIIGKNGIGKTNLLEAVYYLTTGKSFRVSNDEHLMGWDLPNGDYSILTASFFDELANSEIEVKIALKKVNGSSPLKLILLNKKKNNN